MYKFNNQIEEPILVKIQSISDDRGCLIPFTDDIDHSLFHRCYIVENYGIGVIRGLHYHKNEMKIFTIASGAAKFITITLTPEIADRNNIEEISQYAAKYPETIKSWVLSNRHHGVLIIPAYYANGWINLENKTVLVSLSNSRHEVALNDDIRFDPLLIGEHFWKVIGR